LRTRYFRDLLAWQRAMELTKAVYRASAVFPRDEIFGLRSQLRRAAVSVPSNIAEGHGRLSDNLFRIFLAQARGSLYEVETQLMLAADLDFLSPEIAQTLLSDCDAVARLINGLIGVLNIGQTKAHQAALPLTC
jgi:four helix bundle protein